MVAVEGQRVENSCLEEETQQKQREEVTSQVEEAASQVAEVAYPLAIAKGMEEGLLEVVLQEEGRQLVALT